MPDSANQDLVDSFIRRAVNLERFNAGERRKIIKLLKSLEDDLVATLAKSSNLTDWNKARLRALLLQVRDTIRTAYKKMRGHVNDDLTDFAQSEVEWAAAAMNGAIGVDLVTVEFGADQLRSVVNDSMIEGGPQAEWWSRQAQATENAFIDTVRKGIVSGDTTDKIASALRHDIFSGTIRRNVEAIVRSSIASVSNDAREALFEQNQDVIGWVQQHSTLDGRTCFAGNTRIRLASGETKPISQIKVGDKVISGNGKIRHVRGLKVAIASNWCALTTNTGDKIFCTATHPFWTAEETWAEAGQIRRGQLLGRRMLGMRQSVHSTEERRSHPEILQPEMREDSSPRDDLSKVQKVQEEIQNAALFQENPRLLWPPVLPGSEEGNMAGAPATIDARPGFAGDGKTASRVDHSPVPVATDYATVESIETFDRPDFCYDIEVEEDHTYLVGSGLIVHNTKICIAYSGKRWRLPDYEPIGHRLPYNNGCPRHWNCRSTIVPGLPAFAQLGDPMGKKDSARAEKLFRSRLRDQGMDDQTIKRAMMRAQASMDGYVPEDLDYSSWLKTKSEEFQKKVLGPARWQMWKDGKITLTELVSGEGDPLTIDQLKAS